VLTGTTTTVTQALGFFKSHRGNILRKSLATPNWQHHQYQRVPLNITTTGIHGHGGTGFRNDSRHVLVDNFQLFDLAGKKELQFHKGPLPKSRSSCSMVRTVTMSANNARGVRKIGTLSSSWGVILAFFLIVIFFFLFVVGSATATTIANVPSLDSSTFSSLSLLSCQWRVWDYRLAGTFAGGLALPDSGKKVLRALGSVFLFCFASKIAFCHPLVCIIAAHIVVVT
jgi:hypothetical protein